MTERGEGRRRRRREEAEAKDCFGAGRSLARSLCRQSLQSLVSTRAEKLAEFGEQIHKSSRARASEQEARWHLGLGRPRPAAEWERAIWYYAHALDDWKRHFFAFLLSFRGISPVTETCTNPCKIWYLHFSGWENSTFQHILVCQNGTVLQCKASKYYFSLHECTFAHIAPSVVIAEYYSCNLFNSFHYFLKAFNMKNLYIFVSMCPITFSITYRFGLYVVCVLRGTAYFSRRDLVWPRARYITQPSPQLKGQICA